jgi:hypothetical protein
MVMFFHPLFFIQLYISTLTRVRCTQKLFKYNETVHIPFRFRNVSSSHEQINKSIAIFVSNQNSMKSHDSLEVNYGLHHTVQRNVIVISLSVRKPFTSSQTLCTYCWTITRVVVVNFFHIAQVNSEMVKSDWLKEAFANVSLFPGTLKKKVQLFLKYRTLRSAKTLWFYVEYQHTIVEVAQRIKCKWY